MRRLGLVCLLLLSTSAWSDERILRFHSDVQVFADGMIEVTETIKVRAEGKEIRRGIYRDFPVEYEDRFGNAYRVKVEPLSLQRNDRREAFHSVPNQHDIRTYFGSRDRMLAAGEHTYVYRYRVNRLLGYFAEHDELYWNVTGNRWRFPIDKATATVRLEFDVPPQELTIDGYTGRFGSGAQNYTSSVTESGAVQFAANGPLPVAHGLTIVVGWPKGFVAEPGAGQKLGWALRDNSDLLIAVVGWLLLLAYYIPTWRKHGKDPEPGIIVTRYTPPKGFSPASLRYIRQMDYDDKVLTAAILNLAVKGYLAIDNDGDVHTLTKRHSATVREPLAAGEEELYNALFSEGDVLRLEQENHKHLRKARWKHSKSLGADFDKTYFQLNVKLSLPALLITMITIGLSAAQDDTAPLTLAMLVVLLITLAIFVGIMSRPTDRGRKLLDEIRGFVDYLEIAEKDELNLRNPPDKTPELFETYLPYALALGVDQEWSERFTSVLASIRRPDGSSYRPAWYNGNWNSSDLAGTTRGFSRGLSSAVTAATRSPSSSSGGGGGGSSGGGGGGGGGGGW